MKPSKNRALAKVSAKQGQKSVSASIFEFNLSSANAMQGRKSTSAPISEFNLSSAYAKQGRKIVSVGVKLKWCSGDMWWICCKDCISKGQCKAEKEEC